MDWPRSNKVARLLFFLNALIWLLFAIITLIRMANGHPNPSLTFTIVAILLFGNAGAMLICGLLLEQKKPIYYLALVVLLANILLTFTDEFGLFDFTTLVIDVILLELLIVGRKEYLFQAKTP